MHYSVPGVLLPVKAQEELMGFVYGTLIYFGILFCVAGVACWAKGRQLDRVGLTGAEREKAWERAFRSMSEPM